MDEPALRRALAGRYEIAALLAHPHIVPLYDSGAAGGFVFYAMPHIAGGSLRAVLRHGPLTLAHAAAITTQVADAIGYAHRTGVLHRDLKPENILVDGVHAYVVDFGIAKALTAAAGDALTRTGFALGTPGYMSPEQAAGLRDVDARTDVYGLACVVYEMLVGEVPGFWITDAALRVGRIVDAAPAHRERLDTLPGRVEQVLTRALALRPDDRWPTIDAFAAALADATSGPAARYSAAQVREIVGRAAQLESERPTGETLFTVGGVERIAAEVDIPLEDVHRAMRELGFTPEPASRTPLAPLPLTTPARIPVASIPGASVVVDRVAEREVPASAFPAIVAELERTFGPGRSTVWEGTLTWRTEGAPDTSDRYVEVTVTPRDGRTRLQLSEWRPRVRGIVPATGVGVLAGGSIGSMLGFLLSGGEGGFAGVLAVAGMAAGGAIFQRAWRIGDRENATRRLEAFVSMLLPPGTPAGP